MFSIVFLLEILQLYRDGSGTSMAAPAVTGTVALMLQQYTTTYGTGRGQGPPWPSTIRAALIQSAHDIAGPRWFTNADAGVRAFVGPDFVTWS